MAAASDVSPQSAYIQHHLVHLNNTGEKQSAIAQFDVINYDSLFWSALTGLIVIFFLWRAAPPTAFRAACRPSWKWSWTWSTTRPRHRPQRQEPSVRGPAGPDRVPLDHPDERARPAAGRSAALHLALDRPGRRARRPALLSPHSPDRRPERADGHVPGRAAADVLLRHQDQAPGRLRQELFTAPFHAHGIAAVVLAPSTCC